jgi:hypothetical protein
MQNKKIAALALIIAIALSAFGFVYAHWSDLVTITGTVDMGSVTLAFSTAEDPTCAEYYVNPNPPPELVLGEWEDKEVGSCNVYYSELITDVHTGKEGFKVLNIEIDNAYPQYRVHTTYIVHNIGTVPLYVYGLELTGEKKDSDGNVIYDLIMTSTINAEDQIVGEIYEDVDGSGTVTAGDILVINVLVKNIAFPLQLEPSSSDKEEIDLDFKQEAEECHTYALHFSLLAVQWNKLDDVYP